MLDNAATEANSRISVYTIIPACSSVFCGAYVGLGASNHYEPVTPFREGAGHVNRGERSAWPPKRPMYTG